jgi:hypothetical protein
MLAPDRAHGAGGSFGRRRDDGRLEKSIVCAAPPARNAAFPLGRISGESKSHVAIGAFCAMVRTMIDPDEREPYAVKSEDGRFSVVNWDGSVILVCGDAPSAEQYTALMNQAFRCGFKAGFRKARKP